MTRLFVNEKGFQSLLIFNVIGEEKKESSSNIYNKWSITDIFKVENMNAIDQVIYPFLSNKIHLIRFDQVDDR